MPSRPIYFRTLRPADIPAGLRLCRQARWNQLAGDWELFLTLSPEGCRAAVHQAQVVGTVTTVNYQNRFAWVGMVLVDPEFRGQGIGTRLLEEALDILRDLNCVRLDATPQGRPVYQRLNFVDEYELSRMQIDVPDSGLPALENEMGVYRPRRLTDNDLETASTIDRELFGADRSRLLSWLLVQAPEYAWLVEERSGIEGYCFGRHGFNFDQIGPIYASSQAGAQALVAACLASTKCNRIILDPLHHSPGWVEWLQRLGFVHQRPFTRMYLGKNSYPGKPAEQWAILGPEFG